MAEVMVLYVTQIIFQGRYVGPRLTMDHEHELAVKIKSRIADDILRYHGNKVKFVHKIGTSPAKTICQVAQETGVDCIVIGSHKRSLLSRLVHQGVSHEVFVRSCVPVFIIRESNSPGLVPKPVRSIQLIK